MNIRVIVHKAEEGGYWAEVPSIPGCVSQGDTIEELQTNIQDAIEGCLSIDLEQIEQIDTDQIMEISV